jgi:hypothetical protein
MITIEEANKLIDTLDDVCGREQIIEDWQKKGLVELNIKQELLAKAKNYKNICNHNSLAYELAILVIKYFEEKDHDNN